mmetsp:Transcript_40597/g.36021  ORF Transcript_40597/g.36021 Transcript_40597/m.36021 type:complete len:306 (+) Transcript_40597:1115-2032(+)
MINFVLRAVLERLCKYEKYGTNTDFLRNFSQKLFFAQFFNTAIAFTLVQVQVGNYYGPGGLLQGVYQIHLLNAALPFVYTVIDSGYLIKYFKRKKIEKDAAEGKPIMMVQRELDAIYENPQFSFAMKYAGYVKTVCSASLFTSIVPLAMLYSLISLFFSYWLDKWVMLRRRARGVAFGPEFPIEFIEYLEYPVILFAIGNIGFFYQLTTLHSQSWTAYVVAILGAVLGIVAAIAPMEKVNEYLFPIPDMELAQEKYSEIKMKLPEDYDRFNPATRDIALEAYRAAKEGSASIKRSSILKQENDNL